jgi:hypothetical protein
MLNWLQLLVAYDCRKAMDGITTSDVVAGCAESCGMAHPRFEQQSTFDKT